MTFAIEWAAAPGGAREPYDHTFAHLRLFVGQDSVLRILDKEAGSTRDWLFVPVYPLAEWIVANWWRLIEEPQTPQRGVEPADYILRHSLRHVGGGFAYPDVRVIPEGDAVRVEWHELETRHQNVDFLSRGTIRLPRLEVEQALDDLVRKTVSRLDAHHIAETTVHLDWAAIQNASAQEADFCRSAGWLGSDPYDMEDSAADLLIAVWGEVPAQIRADFFQATTVANLTAASKWVRGGLEQIKQSTNHDGKWTEVRDRVSAAPQHSPLPWEQGYQWARHLRAELGLSDKVPLDLQDVLQTEFKVVKAQDPPSRSFEAIVATNPADGVCCYTAKSHKDSRRFLEARAVMDLVFGTTPRQPTLLSPAQTDRQQRSRAFAAELLAPASLLQPRLSGEEVDEEELEDLADRFKVSSELVRRQIQNHRLARLALPT